MKQFLILLFLCGVCLGVYGPDIGDGTGSSAANALNIDSAGAWATLAATTADWGKYFRVTADIDFEDAVIEHVGDHVNTFTGEFDGNGFTFSNATNNQTPDTFNAVAMFRKATGATIQDLTVTNFTSVGTSPTATQSYCGVLIGESIYPTTVTNCHIINPTVTLRHTQAAGTQRASVGAMIGANHGTVSGCSVVGGTVKGDITAGLYMPIGGIVGWQGTGEIAAEVGIIENSTSSAAVSSNAGDSAIIAYVGGIAGQSTYSAGITTYSLIDTCTFSGSINFTSISEVNVGGIVGETGGSTIDCVNTGSITLTSTEATTSSKVGGIFANIINSGTASRLLNSNTATCDITTTTTKGVVVGGVGAMMYGNLLDCSFTGGITSTIGSKVTNMGGILAYGRTGATVDNCFADVDIQVVSDGVSIAGGIGQLDSGVASNCYAKGTFFNITDGNTNATTSFWGGFAGQNAGTSTLQQCYAAVGPWTDSTSNWDNGFVGYNPSGTVTECYWDTDIADSGKLDIHATEATTVQLQTKSTFDGTGWDFDPAGGQDWKMASAGQYPLLDWEVFAYSGGSGTESNPYKIGTTLDFTYAIEDVDSRSAATYYVNSAEFVYDTYLNYLKGGGRGRLNRITRTGD